ncbi:open rectifier potassium channel protein 1 isoform X2 [Sitophilus oryzae]|nr:open rectifier potassium channel protein 1 isoform X2 [Sitophilus oryzae]
MSKKQWFVVLCLYVLYLLAGAAIFFFIESREEHRRADDDKEEKIELENLLKEHFQGNYSTKKQLFEKLSGYCGKPLGINMSEDPPDYKWDFYHSLFFVITVVSTIGYGNLAPTTMFTRIFMIFYGLIGIPMNGIVIFTLGEFFGKSFTKLHARWKNSKLEAKLDYDVAKLGLIGQVILYLIPGFTFFIFLPSTIMSVFEGWEYDISVYYSFVTLTTIGFGDFVAGAQDTFGFGNLYFVYQLFLLVWIIGGMGYVAMILSYITNAMRSKRVIKIERLLADNIKNTPKRIRTELRSLLHELLFLRVKPVYKGEFEYVPSILERSQSCPEFSIYKEASPATLRKRAMSECYKSTPLAKVQSDTELQKIDKEMTFRPTSELLEQTGLLFKVVNALSCESLNRQGLEGGIHCFSDSEVLASEYYEPGITQVKPKKRRAISDVRPPSRLVNEAINGNTWYGGEAAAAAKTLKEFKKRQRARSVFQVKKPEKENVFQRIRNRLLSRDESSHQDIEKQKIPDEFEKACLDVPMSTYGRRGSMLSSVIGNVQNAQRDHILEQTSIADFIRALSAITTTDTLEKEESTSQVPKMRRHGIIATPSRRSSLIPNTTPPEVRTQRRFSLRPADENILNHPVKRKDKMRKISVAFQDDRRNSLILEATPSIPPTLTEHELFAPAETRCKKSSATAAPTVEEAAGPPPYSLYPLERKRFTVRPVNLSTSVITSPIQKQLHKRDRTDSFSKDSK